MTEPLKEDWDGLRDQIHFLLSKHFISDAQGVCLVLCRLGKQLESLGQKFDIIESVEEDVKSSSQPLDSNKIIELKKPLKKKKENIYEDEVEPSESA